MRGLRYFKQTMHEQSLKDEHLLVCNTKNLPNTQIPS